MSVLPNSSAPGVGVGGSAMLGMGRCGGGTETRCDDLGRTLDPFWGCSKACPMKLLPAVARLCVVLTVLSLRTEETDVRFENCRPEIMLGDPCVER